MPRTMTGTRTCFFGEGFPDEEADAPSDLEEDEEDEADFSTDSEAAEVAEE